MANVLLKKILLKKVARLLLGDTEQYPLSASEDATTLGYNRDTVYSYVKSFRI
jgi:hypothetical protein